MTHIVEKERGAFGGPDVFDCKKSPPQKIEDMGFGFAYKKYRGIAPVALENQSWGYRCKSAREVFNYAVNEIGANYMVWTPERSTNYQTKWTIYDAIAVVNAEKGKVNTSRPANAR